MMTGMISGAPIANRVKTGTFTIPLMKQIGFSAEKAGAVEVASSTNGQLTPPVMGAAADDQEIRLTIAERDFDNAKYARQPSSYQPLQAMRWPPFRHKG